MEYWSLRKKMNSIKPLLSCNKNHGKFKNAICFKFDFRIIHKLR